MVDKPQSETGEDADFRALLKQIKTDEKKIEALLEDPVFRRRLNLICHTITDNDADAKDLSSLVEETVWIKFEAFEPNYSRPFGSFFAWVRQIAKNKFCDIHRRKTLRISETKPDELGQIADKGERIDLAFERRQLDEKLRKFIARLDDRERTIVQSYLEHNSFRVAETKLAEHGIECSHVTIRNTVRNALDRFFAEIKIPVEIPRKGDKPSGPHGQGGAPVTHLKKRVS